MAELCVSGRFLIGIVQRAGDERYIDYPQGWKGPKYQPDRERAQGDMILFCATPCICIGGDRSTSQSVGFIGSLFASVITLLYAANSVQSARQAQTDLNEMKGSNSETPTYKAAKILLEGRRNERIVVAIAQGIVTAGMGLLAVAFLVALIVEGDLLYIGLGFGLTGVAFISTGACIYAGTRCCRNEVAMQKAAQDISDALNAPNIQNIQLQEMTSQE